MNEQSAISGVLLPFLRGTINLLCWVLIILSIAYYVGIISRTDIMNALTTLCLPLLLHYYFDTEGK